MARDRPWHAKLRYRLVIVSLALTLLVVLVAMCFSWWRWGFAVRRPAMDARIESVQRVTAFSQARGENGDLRVRDLDDQDGVRSFDRSRVFDREAAAQQRVRRWFAEQRLVPDLIDQTFPQVDEQIVQQVPAWMQAAGVTGTRSSDHLVEFGTSANIYQAVSEDRKPLLIVTHTGGKVGANQYVHYEVVFETSDASPRLLSQRQWRFGERFNRGVNFEYIALRAGAATQGVFGGVALIIVYLRRFSRVSAMRRGWCPMCRHDLVHDLAGGCAECGWRKDPAKMLPAEIRWYMLHQRVWRWLTRPRLLVSPVLALAGVGVCWWSYSPPGEVPDWRVAGPVLAGVAILVLVLKLNAAHRRTVMSARTKRVAKVLVALIGLTFVACVFRVPLHARFVLSKPALDRFVASKELTSSRAGLYRNAIRADVANGGVIVWIRGALYQSMPERSAFVYYELGAPTRPIAMERRIELKPLWGGWFLWEYLDPK